MGGKIRRKDRGFFHEVLESHSQSRPNYYESSSDDDYDYDEITRIRIYDETKRTIVNKYIKEEWVIRHLNVGYGGLKKLTTLIAKDLSKMARTVANNGIVICAGRYELVGKQMIGSVMPFAFIEYKVQALICRPSEKSVLKCGITRVNHETGIALGNFDGDVPIRIIKVPRNLRDGTNVNVVYQSLCLSQAQPYLLARYRGPVK